MGRRSSPQIGTKNRANPKEEPRKNRTKIGGPMSLDFDKRRFSKNFQEKHALVRRSYDTFLPDAVRGPITTPKIEEIPIKTRDKSGQKLEVR